MHIYIYAYIYISLYIIIMHYLLSMYIVNHQTDLRNMTWILDTLRFNGRWPGTLVP